MNMWLKLAFGLGALVALAAMPGAGFAANSGRPTVVELFQSQGCSSCPPAAANLAAISDRPDVLALSFAVDYWNRLGWKDTFSSPRWTARQYEYARAMGGDGVYTPQIVVNGRVAGDGIKPAEFAQLVREGERGSAGPALSFAKGSVTVGQGATPAAGAEVWLVTYDPRTVEVAVRRGENAGRTLPHKDVVRDLTLVGRWQGAAQSFPLPASREGLAEAVIVQANGAGPILAAAKR